METGTYLARRNGVYSFLNPTDNYEYFDDKKEI